MGCVLAQGARWPGAVGVSGGADSLALLFLLADWAAKAQEQPPIVLTVDHGLQRDSKAVAESVAARAKARGLSTHILRWRGRKPQTDIERAARDARYRLMGEWCRANGIGCLFVAHSLEDQAETFLLRLMRGSGVDGLAAMGPVGPCPARGCEDVRLARPFLAIPRSKLRGFLANQDESWFEDEMNTDKRFARARLRADWPALQDMGFSADRIAAAARHLARARAALDRDTRELLVRATRTKARTVLLDTNVIAASSEEISLRAVAQVLMQVSGRVYRPRFDRLERLVAAIRSHSLKGGRTLHGCCIRPAPKRFACFGAGTLSVTREAGRRKNAAGSREFSDVKVSNSP